MSFKKIKETLRQDSLSPTPPEFGFKPEEFAPEPERGSFVLMRVMIVIVNLAALIFSRSFSQSWNSVHGTSPIQIPIIFLLVPFASLFFIYFYMGRIGYEKIIKAICIIFCAVHFINIFSPVKAPDSSDEVGWSSDYGYVTQTGEALGINFPESGEVTTLDSSAVKLENKNVSVMDKIKSLLKSEKLFSCTDAVFTAEQAADFENSLAKNPVWLSEIPDKLSGIPFSLMNSEGYDYYLFFDCDKKRFNSVPESGTHTFYQVMYNSQTHGLRILKYTKNF